MLEAAANASCPVTSFLREQHLSRIASVVHHHRHWLLHDNWLIHVHRLWGRHMYLFVRARLVGGALAAAAPWYRPRLSRHSVRVVVVTHVSVPTIHRLSPLQASNQSIKHTHSRTIKLFINTKRRLKTFFRLGYFFFLLFAISSIADTAV